MRRAKMLDPRGPEYGTYIATIGWETVVVAYYDGQEFADDSEMGRLAFTLRMSAADYPVWKSHIGLTEV